MDFHIQKKWVWIALAAIIAFTLAVRIRLLSVPLERDEGEYAYAGQLILQGIAPYAQVYNMKLPGTYAAYAVILFIFGQTATGIHTGLLIINIATILLLFSLAKKFFGPVVAVLAAAAFAIFSDGQFVLGVFAHATHFILLPALAGLVLLVRGIENKKNFLIFWGAFLLGLAFLMKQHGITFIFFGGFYLVYMLSLSRPFSWIDSLSKSAVFVIGAALPFAITCLILWQYGVFAQFWFWTFEYAGQYVSAFPFKAGLQLFERHITKIISSATLLWLFAILGMVELFLNKDFRKHAAFAIGFLFFSFLSVCPGFYFREHYFITLLPAVALFCALGMRAAIAAGTKSKYFIITNVAPVLLVAAILFYSVYQQRQFFFAMDPATASREIYGPNPFIEAPVIADYIKNHSDQTDRIAVVGSEPEIFFYSNRHSATGFIYTYPLVELHPYASKMQQEMIKEIETAHPRFIVYIHIATSWLARPQSDLSILKWALQYTDTYYKRVGTVTIQSDGASVYQWDQNISNLQPSSEYWVAVFEKKTGSVR